MDELYHNFMASTAGNERARRELQRHLSSKLPEQQSPVNLLPIDEMELRLQYIRNLEDFWRQHFSHLTLKPQSQYREFNDLQVSALLQMDLNSLRHALETGSIWTQGILNSLQALPVAVKICKSSGRR